MTNQNESATDPAAPPADDDRGTVEPVPPFPIVGIGASAGGLAAFEAFFSGMPSNTETGMAFVLVQHLAPHHKSILAELIKRCTRMEVFEVEDGMTVRPNCTYIIPPNREMALLHGRLQLLQPTAAHGLRSPIDFFFRSLAQDLHDRAICIVLSGTGSDGTEGLRAIKSEGGMAMTQDPESAEYDAMPRNAIATGLVDFVMPPREMPAQLIVYADRALGTALRPEPVAQIVDPLKKILVLLRFHTGHDFSEYKQSTVIRRVERRMAVQQIDRISDYVRYLQQNPGEGQVLFRELLIGVTSFFRDPEAFQALDQHMAKVLDGKPAGSVIRAWCAGCSTGEEAYSLAILLREKADATKQALKVQVFATDIDSRAIDTARRGVYPASIAADVSAERLARFFSEDGGSYRVSQSVRDMLVFSEHDVNKDPPFSKLDLISCRNLLIYLGPKLQQRLIPVFHYALNPQGVLFLGTSETVGDSLDLFEELDRKAKVYRSKDDALAMARHKTAIFARHVGEDGRQAADRKAPLEPALPLRELTERALLEYVPVAALVNLRGDLLYLHGHAGKYLELGPGAAALNILKMAREGLQHELQNALQQATTEKAPVRSLGVRVKTNGGYTTIHLTVRPVFAAGSRDGGPSFLLAIFESAPEVSAEPVRKEVPEPAEANVDPDRRLTELKRELQAKEEYLRSAQEEMQTTKEEFSSTNEELQSTNEELQSTNEELETSKEELQSVNEELITVNAELQTKVSDLSRANNDMNNLLAGTGIGTLFIDLELCIQRFTPAVTQLISLIRTDVGRPLRDIMSKFAGYDHLVDDVKEVLDTLVPKEVEVSVASGNWYLLRIRPYRTLENVIEGAVITFTDITELRTAQKALRDNEALRRMAAIVRDARDAITVQDLSGQLLAWNRAATDLYGWTESEALTMNVRALTPPERLETVMAVTERLSRGEVVEPFRTERMTKSGQAVCVWVTPTALVNEAGKLYAVSTLERADERVA